MTTPPPEKTSERFGRARSTLIPVACVATTLTVLAGCAGIAPETPTENVVGNGSDPTAAAVPARLPCWAPTRTTLSTLVPLDSTAPRSFTPTPTDITVGVETSGDEVKARQAILDFPQTQLTDPTANAVVLVSASVHTTNPAGWRLDRAFALMAFEYDRDTTKMTIRCPLDPAQLSGVLRAAGHEALPARLAAGQSAEGWVAFVVPRSSAVLTLRAQRLEDNGDFAASDAPLMSGPTIPPGG